MGIIECSGQEITRKLNHSTESFAVLLYTPMCGTCKLAERMLDIIMNMEPDIPLYKSNMNALVKFSQEWQIESVPCLLIMSQGDLLRKVYAMRSVDHLYNLLRPIMKNNV